MPSIVTTLRALQYSFCRGLKANNFATERHVVKFSLNFKFIKESIHCANLRPDTEFRLATNGHGHK